MSQFTTPWARPNACSAVQEQALAGHSLLWNTRGCRAEPHRGHPVGWAEAPAALSPAGSVDTSWAPVGQRDWHYGGPVSHLAATFRWPPGAGPPAAPSQHRRSPPAPGAAAAGPWPPPSSWPPFSWPGPRAWRGGGAVAEARQAPLSRADSARTGSPRPSSPPRRPARRPPQTRPEARGAAGPGRGLPARSAARPAPPHPDQTRPDQTGPARPSSYSSCPAPPRRQAQPAPPARPAPAGPRFPSVATGQLLPRAHAPPPRSRGQSGRETSPAPGSRAALGNGVRAPAAGLAGAGRRLPSTARPGVHRAARARTCPRPRP